MEGLTGDGKDTSYKILTKDLKTVVYSTHSYPIKIRVGIDSHVNAGSGFPFYIYSILHASHEIKETLNRSNVVCDGYIDSSLCYHYALNTMLAYFEIKNFDILESDFVFYRWTLSEDKIILIAQIENKYLRYIQLIHYDNYLFLS